MHVVLNATMPKCRMREQTIHFIARVGMTFMDNCEKVCCLPGFVKYFLVLCYTGIQHITPSDVRELRKFFYLSQDNINRCTADDLCQAIESANI